MKKNVKIITKKGMERGLPTLLHVKETDKGHTKINEAYEKTWNVLNELLIKAHTLLKKGGCNEKNLKDFYLLKDNAYSTIMGKLDLYLEKKIRKQMLNILDKFIDYYKGKSYLNDLNLKNDTLNLKDEQKEKNKQMFEELRKLIDNLHKNIRKKI